MNFVGRQKGWIFFLRSSYLWLTKWRSSLFPATWTNIRRDWRANKYFPLAVVLLIWTSLVVAAYYSNHPQPEPLADSWSYLYVVDQIQQHGQVVNFWRLPGYPFLICSVYALTGQGNLSAVSVTQGILFILSVLEFYVLSGLLLRRARLAFLISLLVGTNVVLLSYVKPIMSEGMALWLLTTLALAVVLFLHTFRLRFFWLVVFCTLLLFFTRPEWIYLPPFLFAYLLLASFWRGIWRRFLLPAVFALLLLYSFLGGYALLNTVQNHFNGVTWIQNINLLGKVLQYRMEDEASSQDAGISHILNAYLKQGIADPYIILSEQPVLASDYAARSGEFAKEVILHHPLEFLLKSVPVFFSSLTDFHLESLVLPSGPFGVPLGWLLGVFRILYNCNICFPCCALVWMLLLCSQRMRQREIVQKMGAVVLLALYGLIVTTLAGYRAIDYVRIYTVLDPLLFLIMGGTLLAPFLFTHAERPHVTAEAKGGGVVNRSSHTASGMPVKVGLCLLLCLLLFIWGAPEAPASYVSAYLVPLNCHRESDATMLRGTGVGILFITIENRGHDAGSSTIQVRFKTNSSVMPWVKLDEALPELPAGAYRYIMVDIPRLPQGGSFLDPVGPLTISLKTVGESKLDGTLVTNC